MFKKYYPHVHTYIDASFVSIIRPGIERVFYENYTGKKRKYVPKPDNFRRCIVIYRPYRANILGQWFVKRRWDTDDVFNIQEQLQAQKLGWA